MIPFCKGNAILTVILGSEDTLDTRNDDYNWHLKAKATPTQDPWFLRLLPGFVRTPLKARREARHYEDTLISLWETSPHLLSDIGVVLSTNLAIPEHLVAAPARVIDHVKTTAGELAAATAVEQAVEMPAASAPVSPARKQEQHIGTLAGLPA